MKINEPVKEMIGDATFYIYPFPAMKAANMTGDLAGMILPILGGLAPFIANAKKGQDGGVLDTDLSEVGPAVANAFATFSGDKVERFLRKMLLENRNISVERPEWGNPKWLTEEVANEVFCGETQDMLILAFYVVRVNFSGFFKKLVGQFGMDGEKLTTILEKATSMASSMPPSSAI